VTIGREWSSLIRRTSLLGRTVLWTGGTAWRGFAINTSNKNMKEKRVWFNFGMRNAECGIKNLKIKSIILPFFNLKSSQPVGKASSIRFLSFPRKWESSILDIS
jgi:hypothetical protein